MLPGAFCLLCRQMGETSRATTESAATVFSGSDVIGTSWLFRPQLLIADLSTNAPIRTAAIGEMAKVVSQRRQCSGPRRALEHPVVHFSLSHRY
jgi:hypothetical protein